MFVVEEYFINLTPVINIRFIFKNYMSLYNSGTKILLGMFNFIIKSIIWYGSEKALIYYLLITSQASTRSFGNQIVE